MTLPESILLKSIVSIRDTPEDLGHKNAIKCTAIICFIVSYPKIANGNHKRKDLHAEAAHGQFKSFN